MDPNTAPQDNNSQPPKSLISLEDAQAVFTELGLQNLPEEKKTQMLETMIDTVMDRIFQRIEPTLSENDKKMLTDLEMRPDADNAMTNYLVAIVPNLDAIATEEIISYKRELKSQIGDIMNVYDEEMGKKAEEGTEAAQPVAAPASEQAELNQPAVLPPIPDDNPVEPLPAPVVPETVSAPDALSAEPSAFSGLGNTSVEAPDFPPQDQTASQSGNDAST